MFFFVFVILKDLEILNIVWIFGWSNKFIMSKRFCVCEICYMLKIKCELLKMDFGLCEWCVRMGIECVFVVRRW